MIVLVLRAVLSWFPVAYDSPVRRVANVLDVITEPVLGPIRRAIPPISFGGMGLDVSFLIVFVVIIVLQRMLCF
jgi:YggT family protein